jgi:hypothetical protein
MCKQFGGASICEHNRQREAGASHAAGRASASTTAKGTGASSAAERGEHLRAQPPKKQVQAVRRVEHLRTQVVLCGCVTQPHKKRVQAMRRGEHLQAQPPKKHVQAMRRGEHMRAQPQKKRVQGIRRVEHLRAQPQKEQLQELPAEGGLVLLEYIHDEINRGTFRAKRNLQAIRIGICEKKRVQAMRRVGQSVQKKPLFFLSHQKSEISIRKSLVN